MPNIYLKNEIGEDIAYENIDTLTVRRVEGGTATYTFGNPQATDAWNMVEELIHTPNDASGYYTYVLETNSGKIVSSSYPNFGTWFQSRNDAWRISDSNAQSMSASYIGVATDFGAVLYNIQNKAYVWDEINNILRPLNNDIGSIYLNHVDQFGTKYLLLGYHGWVVLDGETLIDSLLLSSSGTITQWYTLKVDGGFLVSPSSSSSSIKGIYFIDTTNFTYSQIFSEGYGWLGIHRKPDMQEFSQYYPKQIHPLSNGFLISSINQSSHGILFYSNAEKTITRLSSTGYNYLSEEYLYNRRIYSGSGYSHIIEGYGIVVSSNSASSINKVYFYDFDDGSLTEIASSAIFGYWLERDDLSIGSHSTYGALIFDKKNKTWYRPVTTGQFDNALILDDGILLGGTQSSVGLKYYKFSTGVVTTVQTSYGQWRHMEKVSGGAVVTSEQTSSGIWFFNESSVTLSNLFSGGGFWRISKSGEALLLGNSSTGATPKIYKNGTLSDITIPASQTYMAYMAPVNGGWIVSSSYSSSVRPWFVSASTAEASFVFDNTGAYGYMIGVPFAQWSRCLVQFKSSLSYNKKYGNYVILSTGESSSSYSTLIWDNVNNRPLLGYIWRNSSDTPSTTNTYMLMGITQNPYFLEIDENTVLILGGYTGGSGYPYVFDHSNGTLYGFVDVNFYTMNVNEYTYAPDIVIRGTSDGFIFFNKRTAYPHGAEAWSASAGVYHYNKNNKKVTRLKSTGFYDSTEDAPGGFYIFNSRYPMLDKCYWNNETNTLTEIPY